VLTAGHLSNGDKLCCERVKWIMFQDMCALIVVRNAVMESSTTCPGTEIVDCDEDNWVGKKRSVECDDSCPAVPNPTEVYECGGWQEIYRKIGAQLCIAQRSATRRSAQLTA